MTEVWSGAVGNSDFYVGEGRFHINTKYYGIFHYEKYREHTEIYLPKKILPWVQK